MSTQLVKGQNMSLASRQLRITVRVQHTADLSALLVTSAGKVRSDADFVFFNQPSGPGVRCHQSAGGEPWRVDLDLDQIPLDIDRVRIVTSLDGGGIRFGQFPPPVAQVTDDLGTPVAEYTITGLDSESILIAVEAYRRTGQWKLRAVGQGYAGGLADLITDHGVSVDDPGPSAAAAPPVPDVPPVFAAPFVPPAPPAPFMPPTHAMPSVHAMPAGPPVPGPQGYADLPWSVATQAQPAVEQTADLAAQSGRPVSLAQGQHVSLPHLNVPPLSMIRMGLGWDPIKERGVFGRREVDIDLDAAAVMFADQQPVDVVFFNHRRSNDGSVQHSGDNRSGAGDGDDESITVDLSRVPVHVNNVFFVVASYKGHTFQQVQNAFCRVVDETTRRELARYTLAGGTPCTSMIMARLHRDNGVWNMHAIGEAAQARTAIDLIPYLARFTA